MPVTEHLNSAFRGALWLVRGGGLRHRLHSLEGRLRAVDAQVSRTAQRLDDAAEEARREAQRAAWLRAGDLRAFERRVYSQNGEDGILEEILRRVGAPRKYFVEFGVETGEQCNCARLALEEGWHGLFIEGFAPYFEHLRERYRPRPGVRCLQAYVSAANIEPLLRQQGVPLDLDVLSIDIDGNDYWVWAAIHHWRPRVVVIEYNASHPPGKKWVMQENPDHGWDGTTYYGASLTSLTFLGRQKGYTLVVTNSSGVNAFFVRDDLVTADQFLDPAVHYHYSRPTYGSVLGSHPQRSGPFVEI
jgi:hypothetical protein